MTVDAASPFEFQLTLRWAAHKTNAVAVSRKKPKKTSSRKTNSTISSYEREMELTKPKQLTGWELWKEKFKAKAHELHIRGLQRLTIMVIPHTEKRIIHLHVSVYAVAVSIATISLVLIISVISLVGKSGEEIQFYDMGLTNSQFNLQSTKMASEIIPLHEMIREYSNTIAEMYVKLDAQGADLTGQGGAAQGKLSDEVESLKKLAEECKRLGEDCDQAKTEEILRQIVFLSKQDNQSLRRALELSEKILTELKSKEKQSLLRHTPGIWPVKGYVVSPYGEQMDQLRGKRVFRRGVEIGAPVGTEVLSTAPGQITEVGYDDEFGLYVWVTHRYGIKTFYAHLDRSRVKISDKVAKGDVIGFVGKSGTAPVSMLYYEVHVGTVAYNPHAFLNHLQDLWLIQPKP